MSETVQRRPYEPAHGFTLLEIMLAIFVFAVVVTMVFGSFRAVFSSADAVGGDVALFATARACLNRMAGDLQALHIADFPRYAKPEFNDDQDPYRLVGDTSDVGGKTFGRLRFASLAYLPFHQDPRQGVGRIVYYVHQRDDDVLVLRRSQQLYPFPDFEESDDDPILCDNLLALEFGYVDDEDEVNDRWDSESADSDYATPRVVDIRLTLGTDDRPLQFTTRIPLHVHRQPSE
jgi:general secretion pathway protein J